MALLGLAVTIIGGVGAGSSVAAGPGQYGPPEWFPLRHTPSGGDIRVGCTYRSFGGPYYECGGYHDWWALDLGAAIGSPVFAAGAGFATVYSTWSGCGNDAGDFGNAIVVNHDSFGRTIYGHLSEIQIPPGGAWVDQNSQIGLVGNTGHSSCTFPHLHYEKVNQGGTFGRNGTSVNPGSLKACHGSTLRSYPTDLTGSPPWSGTWEGIPWGVYYAHSDGTGCVPPPIPPRWGNVQLVNSASDGTPGNGYASGESDEWSPTGAKIAFNSGASNLVSPPVNNPSQLYLKNPVTGATELVSATADGAANTAETYAGRWSPDGAKIAFFSALPTNLVPDPGTVEEANDLLLIVKNVQTGAVRSFRASNDVAVTSGPPLNWSPDGTKIAFVSTATMLDPRGTNGYAGNVYVLDVETGALELISESVTPEPGDVGADRHALGPVWSPDGSKLAFRSDATDLVLPGPPAFTCETYVHSFATGALRLVSAADNGTPANRDACGYDAGGDARTQQLMLWRPDGNAIMFGSEATNLVGEDTGGLRHVFVKDLATGDVRVIDSTSNGVAANRAVLSPFSSMWKPDGTAVAFTSDASNLVATPLNGTGQVFIKKLSDGSVSIASTDSLSAPMSTSAQDAVWSPDGTKIAFHSNMRPELPNRQLLVKDLGTGTLSLVSAAPDGTAGDDHSHLSGATWSRDGRWIAFYSVATNLVPGAALGQVPQLYASHVLGSPTAVRITGLSATSTGSKVIISWRTASEAGIGGFNLYRSVRGKRPVKLNRMLIEARYAGTTRSARYTYVDGSIGRPASHTYQVQAVGLDGRTIWTGATRIASARQR